MQLQAAMTFLLEEKQCLTFSKVQACYATSYAETLSMKNYILNLQLIQKQEQKLRECWEKKEDLKKTITMNSTQHIWKKQKDTKYSCSTPPSKNSSQKAWNSWKAWQHHSSQKTSSTTQEDT